MKLDIHGMEFEIDPNLRYSYFYFGTIGDPCRRLDGEKLAEDYNAMTKEQVIRDLKLHIHEFYGQTLPDFIYKQDRLSDETIEKIIVFWQELNCQPAPKMRSE